jgi:two-component system, NtrC family, sensor histidine kinase KinB
MLRTRIFLNLLPFTIILIAVVAFALFLFSRLANSVGVTITQNYHSDAAAVAMMLAVDRMDAALKNSHTEDKGTAQLMFDTNCRLFEESLQSQLTNAAAVMNLPRLLQLQTNFTTLQRLGTAVFAPDLKPEEMKRRHGETVPVRTVLDLLLNGKEGMREEIRNNIFATDKTIQKVTRTISSLLILGLAVGLAIYGYASFKLGQAILQPIQTLTNAAREIGEGKLDLTVPVLSQDELGELATTFNKMAAQLSEYRQGINEQIVRLHHTMEAALASFTDPVFILETSGRVELKNRAARELTAQLALDAALPPKLAEAADVVIRNNRDFVPDSFSEVITMRVNAGEKSFLPRIHLMRNPDGKPVGAAVVLHDVTRFRLLDDAKTNLVATVSHELKTPLTSVRLVLHMLLEKSLGPLTARQNELIQTARRDAERLLRILDSLLDIARLETGAASLTRELVPPADLVQVIAEELRRHALPQGFKITTHAQAGLPLVAVDRQQIGHVFHNLISNAMKHSPPGANIVISALADDGNTGVQFMVRDEGGGIAEEFQGRIFERFYRVPGQARTGVGLGLSIVREIIVAHGGRVGVRSQLGKGSEFYFVLEAAKVMD